ncbi:GNAT family N-acetyltransferase [Jatrophihabitans endophyticus]|uniref:GNAT family N-acetyltransferase n=1 Tax=Jatrophihabitans endophyticus TaxID=1206085 RepID=UPI0026ECF834|nr:GNAT family N-acetyltransferase [Jatrophihabitans endophyticus]
MDEIETGTAGVQDAAEIAALVKLAYRGDDSRTGWTTEADLLADDRIDAAGVREKIETPDSEVLTVRDDSGRLVACCELVSRGDGLAYFGMFAVRPDLQSGGMGRRILAAAERLAVHRWSATRMEMTVIGQRSELIAWYERRGYRLTGERRPFHYDQLVNGPALRDDLYFAVLTKDL